MFMDFRVQSLITLYFANEKNVWTEFWVPWKGLRKTLYGLVIEFTLLDRNNCSVCQSFGLRIVCHLLMTNHSKKTNIPSPAISNYVHLTVKIPRGSNMSISKKNPSCCNRCSNELCHVFWVVWCDWTTSKKTICLTQIWYNSPCIINSFIINEVKNCKTSDVKY